MSDQDRLIVERLGDETLIYDAATDHAHALDAHAAAVWDAARAGGDAVVIAAACDLPQDVVEDTLEDLADRGLLRSGSTRREHLRKAALTGAGLTVAAPIIRSIVAPTAAQASTLLPPGSPCVSGGQCQYGVCNPANNTCA